MANVGLKCLKSTKFSNEIQLSLNHFYSEIFEILGVDKQMVIICGQVEPHRSPKKSVFSCVIGIYLMSFFYEHPVYPRVHSHLSIGNNQVSQKKVP